MAEQFSRPNHLPLHCGHAPDNVKIKWLAELISYLLEMSSVARQLSGLHLHGAEVTCNHYHHMSCRTTIQLGHYFPRCIGNSNDHEYKMSLHTLSFSRKSQPTSCIVTCCWPAAVLHDSPITYHTT